MISTFVSAFHRVPSDQIETVRNQKQTGEHEYNFDITLEIKEDDGRVRSISHSILQIHRCTEFSGQFQCCTAG